jgi:hypothetical protein
VEEFGWPPGLGPYFTPDPFLHNVDIVPHALIHTHSYAAYADGSYELFSGLFAEAGVRVTREISKRLIIRVLPI